MSFNPADYAEVAERLPLFWKDCPRGRIITEIVVDDGTRIVMRAELYADIGDLVPTTTGFREWCKEVFCQTFGNSFFAFAISLSAS